MWKLGTAKKSGPVEYLIVGLGNPGPKYAHTRHNAGASALSAIAEKAGVRVDRVKFKSLTAQCELGGVRVLLMAPQTFMNCSGEAVVEAMHFYKVDPTHVLILQDDISLDVGALRIRRKGSDGGQKGVRSIIELTDSEEFPRIKLGIGKKPHPDYDLAAWVLSEFSVAEQKLLGEVCATAAEAAELIVQGKIDLAMNRYSH